jgi:hypothetical protein
LKPFKLFFICALLCLSSCDDGDIIVTTFDFDEETNLSLCQDDNLNILYFIDSETNEAISFVFTLDDFDGTFTSIDETTVELSPINITSSNQVIYRKLSGGINGNNYFCQQIPPSSPQVLEEFVSTTGGTATLQIRILEQDDDDDVPAALEDLNGNGDLFDDDSDGDGIPNFLDTDDDNDNVLTTSEELEAVDENGVVITDPEGNVVYVDTDGDGTPNYRDDDDDGDGVITRYEDLNVCEDPENPALNPDNDTNADDLANYLNENATESLVIDVIKANSVTRSFFTQVVFNDITFENQNSDESLTFTNFIMGRYTRSNIEQVLEFNDTVVSEDDVDNICQ